MFLNLLVIPRYNGPASQVLQLSLRSLSLQLVIDSRLHPVLMGEKNRLSRAFLTCGSVSVLIRCPCNVVGIENVRAKDLPIKPSILHSNSAVELLGQMLSNSATSCELGNTEVCMIKNVFHLLVGAVQEIYVLKRHATGLRK